MNRTGIETEQNENTKKIDGTIKRNRTKGIVIAVTCILFVIIIFLLYQNIEKNRTHEYYCDNFLLTVDDIQIDLQQVEPAITAVVELLPITNQELAVVCRIDGEQNFLAVYSFSEKDFIFKEYGNAFAWVQDDYDSTVYQQGDVVYDLDGNEITRAEEQEHIFVIEYIDTDFYVTFTDDNYENPRQVKVE